MANSLFPACIRLFYRTPNAPHIMTLPVTTWSPVSGGHVAGTCLAWDGSQIDVDDMVSALVALLLPFWGSDTHFTNYQVDTFDDKDAPARPAVNRGLTGAAGSGSTGIPAAQATFSFKTSDFGVFKLVMLDGKVSSTFQPLDALVSPANDAEIALIAEIEADTNAWSGRDNHQVVSFKRVTYTLNEKLRAEYKRN